MWQENRKILFILHKGSNVGNSFFQEELISERLLKKYYEVNKIRVIFSSKKVKNTGQVDHCLAETHSETTVK